MVIFLKLKSKKLPHKKVLEKFKHIPKYDIRFYKLILRILNKLLRPLKVVFRSIESKIRRNDRMKLFWKTLIIRRKKTRSALNQYFQKDYT